MELLARLPREAIDEVLHEDRDVLVPLLQRREVDVEDVQAEVEVLAEAAALDLVLELAVRGADHAHVDRDLALAAQTAEPLLFEHAEELRLQLDGNLADFVEEERPAVGQLPGSEAPLLGAGEGSALVTEHLALDERGGNGRAVDGDERLVAARAELMDGAGHHLLAGAALAGDHHAGLGRSHLLHQLHRAPHRGRVAHQPDAGIDLAQAPAQDLHLVEGFLLLQRALEDDPQARRVERLLHEVEDAFADGLDRGVDRPLPGDDHDRGVRLLLSQRADERQPVQLRHHQVADDHVRVGLGGELQRTVAIGRLIHLVTPPLQKLRKKLSSGLFVIDDQDAGLRHDGWLPRVEKGE